MKKIKKILLIIFIPIVAILVASTVNALLNPNKMDILNDSQVKNYTEVEQNSIFTEGTKENSQKKIEYKVCTDEFFNHISNIKNQLIEESIYFNSGYFRYRIPYLVVTLNTSKYIEEKTIKKEIEIIKEKMFNELIKSNYNSKCGLKASYEYINLEFYTYHDKNSKILDYTSYEQYYLLEVNKYKDYSSFKNK